MLKLRNMKVSYKLAMIVAVGILGFLLLLFISINTLKTNLIAERHARLNAVIHTVLSQVESLSQTYAKSEAQNLAKALISATRFDENNYLFVIDENRNTVVHPIKPELVGQQMGNGSDGQFWFTMVDLGRAGGLAHSPICGKTVAVNLPTSCQWCTVLLLGAGSLALGCYWTISKRR